MRPPGHDFYATVAQLVPLLLIAVAVEGHRLSAADETEATPDLLDMSVLLFAMLGEISAIAGLTGNGGRLTASLAALGLGVMGGCALATVSLRFAKAERVGVLRVATGIAAVAIFLSPIVVSVVYAVRLEG